MTQAGGGGGGDGGGAAFETGERELQSRTGPLAEGHSLCASRTISKCMQSGGGGGKAFGEGYSSNGSFFPLSPGQEKPDYSAGGDVDLVLFVWHERKGSQLGFRE